MKKLHKTMVGLILTVFMLGAIIPVYADELEEQQQKLQQVTNEINSTKNKISSTKKEEKSIMGEIQGIEKNIISTQQKISDTDQQIVGLEKSITIVEAEIKQAEAELEEKTDILSGRMVFLYENGDVSYLHVLLASTDIKDFLTRYDMVNSIVDADLGLIEEINQQKQELNIKKADLEVKKKELEIAKASQETLKANLQTQKEQKKVVLGDVQDEKESFEKALKELEQASREMESIIRQLQGGSDMILGTGTYTWPTPGYTNITSPYGMRFHPILKSNRMHTGVDIGAPMSANIVAADSGNVIYQGWMGGYGQVIVVDHGGGMSTLYAHMSSFVAANGAAGTKGQTIGKVGTTGWSTGPHLHFEVRINGNYTDPMPYIR